MSDALSRTADVLARGRPYAERADERTPWYDAIAIASYRSLVLPLVRHAAHRWGGQEAIAREVQAHCGRFRAADSEELRARVVELRRSLRGQGFERSVVAECFALISEAAWRTIGKRHYPCQFMAGWSLLQGRLVEMATGEGKTFAAALPAVVAAWSGRPVHVITVNDYLARRDAMELQPLYTFVGLNVGVVAQDQQRHDRSQAYAQAITYCSNKELAFDYLRDRVTAAGRSSRLHGALARLQGDGGSSARDFVLRGLVFGLVDEADGVFIDDARTPLILSSAGRPGQDVRDFEHALRCARGLEPGRDFRVDARQRTATLLDSATDKVVQHDAGSGIWSSRRAAVEIVNLALCALHLYRRDRDYVVVDGKVQIVDESTGRVMPDRNWEQGLHQMIEVKEGCETTLRRETLTRITYQRLFRRYVQLSGMTGTAAEVAGEVHATYRLGMTRVPLHRPLRRVRWPDRVCYSEAEKWQAVADTVERVAMREGRPVLIGTRSVRSSERISALLTVRGIDHALLNAKQDSQEAEIIAKAGQAGRVTVATNMAGRGTDIKLGPGVAERGGLHVILTEYHESRRVDRQLFGRCARQGNPGTCQAIVALDDELYRLNAPVACASAAALALRWPAVAQFCARVLTWLAQGIAERRNAFARRQTLESDQRLDKMLAFSGRGE